MFYGVTLQGSRLALNYAEEMALLFLVFLVSTSLSRECTSYRISKIHGDAFLGIRVFGSLRKLKFSPAAELWYCVVFLLFSYMMGISDVEMNCLSFIAILICAIDHGIVTN